MAFTVEDFGDLVELLRQHPEWQAELRREILTSELLALPELTRQLMERVGSLAAAQARTEERLETLAAAQARTEERLESLVAAQVQTEERLEALVSAQIRTEAGLQALTTQVATMSGHVDSLRGEALEARYHRHYAAYFGRLARRLRLLESSQVADLVEDALDKGQMTEEEADALRMTDLILAGRSKADGSEIYLVVEASYGIGLGDVERAYARASVLSRLGHPAVPVVAGTWINADAASMAEGRGVQTVITAKSN